jgi:hypothetical protein
MNHKAPQVSRDNSSTSSHVHQERFEEKKSLGKKDPGESLSPPPLPSFLRRPEPPRHITSDPLYDPVKVREKLQNTSNYQELIYILGRFSTAHFDASLFLRRKGALLEKQLSAGLAYPKNLDLRKMNVFQSSFLQPSHFFFRAKPDSSDDLEALLNVPVLKIWPNSLFFLSRFPFYKNFPDTFFIGVLKTEQSKNTNSLLKNTERWISCWTTLIDEIRLHDKTLTQK